MRRWYLPGFRKATDVCEIRDFPIFAHENRGNQPKTVCEIREFPIFAHREQAIRGSRTGSRVIARSATSSPSRVSDFA